MTSFKALVLTCDRYHPFAEHMIRSYQRHWPDHPFVFCLPHQAPPSKLAAKLGEAVRFIPAPAPIKLTIEALFADVGDDEWIYWCPDNTYLIDIDAKTASHAAEWVSR